MFDKSGPNIVVLDNGGRTCDRYTIWIGGDNWYLSENANLPDGVCMYGGHPGEVDIEEGEVEVALKDTPFGVRLAVAQIYRDWYKEDYWYSDCKVCYE